MKTIVLVALNVVVPATAITTTATLLNNHKVELTVLDASAKAHKLATGSKLNICENIEYEQDKTWCTEKQNIIANNTSSN